MARVVFYEKPGCINNTRQKALLKTAGHEVIPKNLLQETWTADRLRLFFGVLPVSEWFNLSAPAIKSGLVVPERLEPQQALALMVNEPLLIRRPLMVVEGDYRAGFDLNDVQQWIGLEPLAGVDDLETCPRSHAVSPCPVAE